MAKRLKEAKTGTGDVQITLQGENRNDLDLHCVDPTGFEISFGKKISASKGWLDVDRNVTPTTNEPIENIFWAKDTAPIGRYRVFVEYFNNHTGLPRRTPFEVRTLFGENVQRFSGDGYACTTPKHRIEIGTFVLERALLLGLPDEVVVNQGGSNTLPLEVMRKRLGGEVSIAFESAGSGLQFRRATIGTASNKADIRLTADAEPGKRRVNVVATCGDTLARGQFVVDLRRVPPALQLGVPPVAEVYPGAPTGSPSRSTACDSPVPSSWPSRATRRG